MGGPHIPDHTQRSVVEIPFVEDHVVEDKTLNSLLLHF